MLREQDVRCIGADAGFDHDEDQDSQAEEPGSRLPYNQHRYTREHGQDEHDSGKASSADES